MRRILKFGLPPRGQVTIESADEPRFLSVGYQPLHGIVAWCEATPGRGVKTTLHALFTGDEAPVGLEYLGTTMLIDPNSGDALVVHVYHEPT